MYFSLKHSPDPRTACFSSPIHNAANRGRITVLTLQWSAAGSNCGVLGQWWDGRCELKGNEEMITAMPSFCFRVFFFFHFPPPL